MESRQGRSEAPSLLRRDALCIPYDVSGSSDPARRLVYAHGIHGCGANTRKTLAPLIDRGWTVVSFDQRGHAGATPLTQPSMYDPEQMGTDLLAIMDDLGWERAWIGGESMGAATSIAAAFVDPDRVRGLLQVVPAISDRLNEVAAAAFPALADVLEREGIDAVIALSAEQVRSLSADPSSEVTEHQIARLEELRVHDPASLACIWRTVPLWVMPEVPRRVSTFGFPVVVAGWRDEPIHRFDLAEAIAGAARDGVLVGFRLGEWIVDRATIGRAIVGPLERLASAG